MNKPVMSARWLGFLRTAAIFIGVFALVFYWSETIVLRYKVPQTGATVRTESRGYRILSVKAGSAAATVGLTRGDLVISPNGFNAADAFFSGSPMPPEKLRPSRILVERGSQTLKMTMRSAYSPYPAADRIRVVARLLAYSVFVLLGVWIAYLRPGLMGWSLLAVCLASAAPEGDILDVYAPYVQTGTPLFYWFSLTDCAIGSLDVFIVIFLLRFPNDTSPGWRGTLLPYALWSIAAYYVVQTLFEGLAPYSLWRIWDPVFGYVDDALYVASLIIITAVYVQSRGAERQRLKWAVTGIWIGTIAFGGNIVARTLSGYTQQGFAIGALFTIASVAMPLCLAYAIVRHRVIDVRFVIGRTILFLGFIGLFAILFIAVDWFTATYIGQSAWQIGFAMAIAFAAGWTLYKVRKPAGFMADRLFFPKRHFAMDRLRDLSIAAETEETSERIEELLVFSAVHEMRLASAALFVGLADGGMLREKTTGWAAGTVWHLLNSDRIVQRAQSSRSKPFRVDDTLFEELKVPDGTARPVLAVPIKTRKGLAALAIYGAHTDGNDIDPDEARGLSALCNAAAPEFEVSTVDAAAIRIPL